MSDAEVIVAREGAAGLLTLNRPKALNALTHGMCTDIAAALAAWKTDATVTRIVVDAAGERAFCAGGDIRVVHDLGRAGRQPEALRFFRDEYDMNIAIKRFPKPYVSLIDGIVMGGGVGVSVHGTHRVAGDKYSFAMPEVGIGFFPDVGGTYALPRLPFHAGTYLALTGARIGRGDAVAIGLATHAVPTAQFAAARAALIAGEDVDTVLSRHSVAAEAAPLLQHKALIEDVFGHDTLAGIFAALEKAAANDAFAAKTLATMQAKSPTSMAISLEQMKRGASLEFEQAMQTEFRIVSRIVYGEEFYEGVRATIIDKDQAPRWSPASIEGLSEAEIGLYFAPLPGETA